MHPGWPNLRHVAEGDGNGMSVEAPASVRQAFAALQQGRHGEARRLFAALAGQAGAGAAAWMGLAYASVATGDGAAADRAADQALTLEPRNIRALLFRADRLAAGASPRKSLAFYERALRLAAEVAERLAPEVEQGLRRGQALTEKFAAEYEDHLVQALKFRGYRATEASARFNLALDICLGRKEIYYQNPSRFYFPGLPQRQFYERGEFPWLGDLESLTDRIRGELVAVMAQLDRFQPYLQSGREPQLPDPAAQGIMDNPDWGALYLWEYGQVVEANAACFPITMQALQSVPLPVVHNQLPIVLFSRLVGGTHIPPHHGMLNTRLICHLPLIVPDNCGALRCGSEQRPWEAGKTLIFDDSIEHEAWNHSGEVRVVLLFDIWRPELGADERALVAQLLEIVKEYNDQPG